MDTLLNVEALPAAAAISGITLFFMREYVKDHMKKSLSLPRPPPRTLSLSVGYL